jgi:hypothetical protein
MQQFAMAGPHGIPAPHPDVASGELTGLSKLSIRQHMKKDSHPPHSL